MTKEDLEKVRKVVISEIEKNDDFVISTRGAVGVVGNQFDATTDIVLLMKYLIKELSQEMKKRILSCLISELKNEEEISDEDEKLAQKILDEIKKLK